MLSQGRGPQAYCAVLAAKGFIDAGELRSIGERASRLGRHPDRTLIPGAEISAGSPGHGLPLAVAVALGLRARGLASARVFVLMGDGELDEGSNFEAIADAGRASLDALTRVVIDNSTAAHGWPGGMEARLALEGWSAPRCDGRDHAALEAALTGGGPGCPHAVVAAV